MSPQGVSLSDLAHELPGLVSVVDPEKRIVDISHDSRLIVPGALYVAIRGEEHDGHAFVSDALASGAAALLVEREPGLGVPHIVVQDTRRAMAWAARTVFERPDTSLAIAGVTGTNGKTTIVHMVDSILTLSGASVGVIGTLGAALGDQPITIERTTPEATDLQRILGAMRDNGATKVVMEVSSHAIALHRSDAISFAVVGFTNLSQDHLDFHHDMETYFDVKKRLFADPPSRRAVINIDNPWGHRMAQNTDLPLVTVSVQSDADIRARNVDMSSTHTTFTIETRGFDAEVRLPLVGAFNVSNALVSAGMSMALGVDLDAVAAGLAELQPIVGRMEIVDHNGPFTVIVDYAHTPDAIAVVLASVRTATSGRIISVVGAGGDRDKDKRPLMGSAAAQHSDLTIVTTDNPRSERPEDIAADVSRHALAQNAAEVEIVVDRREAIQRAVSSARPGDIVLILGKGHETGQDIGTEILPFVDQDVAIDALRSLGWLPI